MNRDHGAERGRRSARRWCVPPAIMRSPGERVEGSGILAESSGDLGLLLWRTVRDVALWGDTPQDLRGNLFAAGSGDARVARLAEADLPSAISASVDTIHGMLTLGARADGAVLSICCLEVAAWAHGSGLQETAIAFAQAGAVAAPEFGEAALHTGIYALRAGQVVRAGTWLRRAVGVSRREGNRPAYAAALVELGRLYESDERPVPAERFFRLGYRAGRRYSARSARMQAVHGLFRLARARGDAASAAEFALAAQGAYESDVGGGPALLLDHGARITGNALLGDGHLRGHRALHLRLQREACGRDPRGKRRLPRPRVHVWRRRKVKRVDHVQRRVRHPGDHAGGLEHGVARG